MTANEANIRYQALNQAYWLAFTHSAAAAEAIRPHALQAYTDYQQATRQEWAASGGLPVDAPIPPLTAEQAEAFLPASPEGFDGPVEKRLLKERATRPIAA